MRGNDRILFLGNMFCLTQTESDHKKTPVQTIWQMKRVLVSDHMIYFFPHTDTYAITKQSDLKDLTLQQFQNLIDDAQQPQTKNQETIPIIQNRLETLKSGIVNDKDSITSPPLTSYQVNINQAYLIELTNLTKFLSLQGIQTQIPQNIKLAIALHNKEQKEVHLMISRNIDDALKFVKAYHVATLFQKYYFKINRDNIAQSPAVVQWLQESVNDKSPTIQFKYSTDDQNKQLLDMYQFIIEESPIATAIQINTILDTPDYLESIKKLFGFFKNRQLTKIIISGQYLHYLHLDQLFPIMAQHQYLQILNFSSNFIEDKGLEMIGKLIEHCYEIKQLDLQKNQIKGGDNNFDLFLLKSSQILDNAMINLSYNLLDDKSISYIENRILFENNTLSLLNLSNNNFSRNGTQRLNQGYKSKISHEFQLILFPLPFSIDMMKHQLDQFIDDQQNKPDLLQRQQINTDQKIDSTGKIKSQIGFIRKQISDYNEEYLLTISRQLTNSSFAQSKQPINKEPQKKQPVTTKVILEQVRQMTLTTEDLFKKYNEDPPVEEVYKITEQIEEFPYQVSLKLIARLSKHIWNKLNEAVLIRDHYSMDYLKNSANNLNISLTFFNDRFLNVNIRIMKLQERITKLLNFEVEEDLINKELDDLISECSRLDIRGLPFKTLICIKLQRDQIIRQLILDKYDWQSEQKYDSLIDSFAFLIRDKEMLDAKIPQKFLDLKLDKNLYLLPTNVNYLELCFGNLSVYQYNLESLRKLQIKYKTYRDRDQITQFTVDEYKIEEYENFEYFVQVAMNRLKFICQHLYFNYNYSIWDNIKDDIQMNSVRMAVNHYFYLQRNKEILQQICLYDNSFQNQSFEDILKRIDNNDDQQINNFDEIEELRFLISHIQIKNKICFQSYSSDPNLNRNESIFQYDIIRYQHIRDFVQKRNDQKNNKKNEQQRRDSILIWVNSQNFTSQLRIDDNVFEYVVEQIKENLRQIFLEVKFIDDQSQNNDLILYQSVAQIIHIIQNSPEPCLFADEMYIQIYLHVVQKEIQDSNFNDELQFYKLIATLLLYIPPSSNFQKYIEVWLIQSSLKVYLQKPVTKAIQYLRSWHLSQSKNSKYSMPDWQPSIFEINQRLKCNSNIEIVIETSNMQQHKLIVGEFAKVGEVMEQIYSSSILEGVIDKYAFWIYKEVISDMFKDKNNVDLHIFEEIALLKEEGILEQISVNNNQFLSNKLLLKRRLYCAWYTISNQLIEEKQFKQLLNELIRKFIHQKYMSLFYSQRTIISIASIISIIFNNKNIFYQLPRYQRINISESDVWTYYKDIIKDFQQYPKDKLQYLLFLIFKLNPTTFGSCFKVLAQSAQKSIPSFKSESLMVVNNFGILFYKWMDQIQNPYKVYLYENIIGCSLTQSEMRLHISDQENQQSLFIIKFLRRQRIILTFNEPRAIECYYDIISYMILRTNEKLYPIYAYNEIFKINHTDKMIHNQNSIQNETVQFILQQAIINMKDQENNSRQSFFTIISKLIRQELLKFQILLIHSIHQDDQKFIVLYIKKLISLQEEQHNIIFNQIDQKYIPYQKNCPFLHQNVKRKIQQNDIGRLFGQNSANEINKLFDPFRNHFNEIKLYNKIPQIKSLNIEEIQDIQNANEQQEQLDQQIYLNTQEQISKLQKRSILESKIEIEQQPEKYQELNVDDGKPLIQQIQQQQQENQQGQEQESELEQTIQNQQQSLELESKLDGDQEYKFQNQQILQQQGLLELQEFYYLEQLFDFEK